MNKPELVKAIASDTGLTQADAGRALDSFIKIVTKTLKKKDDVTIVGFGVFTTAKRKARTGRNPATGEVIKIKASTTPKFRPGKTLKDAV
jgi:DNA-binding protein HU-beta